ncbi:MAG: GGDEF domain-containing protein [Clostridia bacterium]|nr:GGDEF domain-containing protein [Clostridia bacterium]
MVLHHGRFKKIKSQYFSKSSAYLIICLISAFMALFDFIDNKHSYMIISLTFTILCTFNFILSHFGKIWKTIAEIILLIQTMVLFVYLIAGTAGSISVLWICLLPVGGVLFFGMKKTIWLCASMLAILLFMFFAPAGESLTIHFYPLSIRIRIFIFFVAFSVVALFLEQNRISTAKELDVVRKRYQFLYFHDALTTALSRHAFNEIMSSEIMNIKNFPIGFIIIDIDFFKTINDTMGHYKGDLLLKKTYEIIKETTDSHVFRWGGDEFVVFLTGKNNVKEIADEICSTFEVSIKSNVEFTTKTTISIGAISINRKISITIDSLIREADKCLYDAKEQGRNQVVYKELAP